LAPQPILQKITGGLAESMKLKSCEVRDVKFTRRTRSVKRQKAVNELATNALKYLEGNISVHITPEDNTHFLVVIEGLVLALSLLVRIAARIT